MTGSLFATQALSKKYGKFQALTDFTVSIRDGEIVGILGPNGAGKSTLLRILGGLLKGWTGRVWFQDQPLESWQRRPFARQVAYVPQHTHLLFPFTARDVVAMGRLPHQQSHFLESAVDRRKIAEALEMTGSTPFSERYFNDLSGGEKQMVVLASALAQEPKVLLLDEPTVYLDLKHQHQILRVLTRRHESESLTQILITHDLNLARSFCSRLLFLKGGRLAADLDLCRPGSDITPELVAHVFDVEPGTQLYPNRGPLRGQAERRKEP